MKKVFLMACVTAFSSAAFSQSVVTEQTGVKPKNLKTTNAVSNNGFTNAQGVQPSVAAKTKTTTPVVVMDAAVAPVVATEVDVKPALVVTPAKPVVTSKSVKSKTGVKN